MWLDVTIGILIAAAVLFLLRGIYRGYKALENADWKGLFRYIRTGRY